MEIFKDIMEVMLNLLPISLALVFLVWSEVRLNYERTREYRKTCGVMREFVLYLRRKESDNEETKAEA